MSLLIAALQQPLGRDVQQLDLAAADVAENLYLLGRGLSGIQESRVDAVSTQGVDLVLHQRDQRRHHQRQPVQH